MLTLRPSATFFTGQKRTLADDGLAISPETMNGHTEDDHTNFTTSVETAPPRQQLTLDSSQGQGQGSELMTSLPDQTDPSYGFDPLSMGSSSAPLSPPPTDSSRMLVDFDGVAKHLHEASTASVSPQSPENLISDSFALENKENSNPMTSSMIADSLTSSIISDAMTSSFVGDFSDSNHINSGVNPTQICDDVVDVTKDVTSSALPPGGPVSILALQEIGVYSAPPPEENIDIDTAPQSDLVCLDEDGMQMPTTQAPSAPSSNPFSDSLINTQAPMGQSDPFKTVVNGVQSAANPFDNIPGQPPIGLTPTRQSKETFMDTTVPLIPGIKPSTMASSAPGGPKALGLSAGPMEPPLDPKQTIPSSGPARHSMNDPLFQPQPLPDVTHVKVDQKSSGEALLLEDVQTENGPSSTLPVVPPIDLRTSEANKLEVDNTQKSKPKKASSPTKMSSPAQSEQSSGKAQAPSAVSSTRIPSPKRARPLGASTNNNKVPVKKVLPTAAPEAASAKAAPPKSSPRTPAPLKQSPRSASGKTSQREPLKRSPRTTKGF